MAKAFVGVTMFLVCLATLIAVGGCSEGEGELAPPPMPGAPGRAAAVLRVSGKSWENSAEGPIR